MPSNTEMNLKRLEKTTLPWDFVVQHKGEWDHQAWLEFCSSLEDKGYTPINLDAVGLLLEHLKNEFWSERNAR